MLCDSKEFEVFSSIIRILILPINRKNSSTLQSCLCQYVKDLVLLICVFWGSASEADDSEVEDKGLNLYVSLKL